MRLNIPELQTLLDVSTEVSRLLDAEFANTPIAIDRDGHARAERVYDAFAQRALHSIVERDRLTNVPQLVVWWKDHRSPMMEWNFDQRTR